MQCISGLTEHAGRFQGQLLHSRDEVRAVHTNVSAVCLSQGVRPVVKLHVQSRLPTGAEAWFSALSVLSLKLGFSERLGHSLQAQIGGIVD